MLRVFLPRGVCKHSLHVGCVRRASTVLSGVQQCTVAQLLKSRSEGATGNKVVPPIRAVSSDAPIGDAIRLMFEGGTAGTVLATQDARVVGSVNEKDYVCSLKHGSFPPADVKVSQIMLTDILAARSGTSLVTMLQYMLARGRRHVPVVSDDCATRLAANASSPLLVVDVKSIVSLRDVVAFLADATSNLEQAAKSASETAGEAHSKTLSWDSPVEDAIEDMKKRGHKILLNTRLDDNISVANAANVMAEKHMSCVAVVNDDGSIVGVFTARDFLTKVVLPGRNASETLVKDIMTKNPHCAPLDRTVLRCAKSMAKRNFRHLPVVDEKKSNAVIGLLSMADCARVFVASFGDSVPSATGSTGVTILPLQ